jgi:hypothetical protein
MWTSLHLEINFKSFPDTDLRLRQETAVRFLPEPFIEILQHWIKAGGNFCETTFSDMELC